MISWIIASMSSGEWLRPWMINRSLMRPMTTLLTARIAATGVVTFFDRQGHIGVGREGISQRIYRPAFVRVRWRRHALMPLSKRFA